MQQETNPRPGERRTGATVSYRDSLEERAREKKFTAAARELREWRARYRREAHEALRAVFPEWVSSSPSERSTKRLDR